MSLIPVFKIGLWYAWIFMGFFFAATTLLPLLIDKEKMEKRVEGEPTWSELSKTAKIVFVITHIMIMPFTFVYSIFLPLKLGTLWFYAGLPICLLALVMGLMFGISFATAPLGEPLSKGVYAISRHPAYFGAFLGFVGIGIVCASWIYLLYAAVFMILMRFSVEAEERFCLDKYGDAYQEYMNRTPRWIGIPKSGAWR